MRTKQTPRGRTQRHRIHPPRQHRRAPSQAVGGEGGKRLALGVKLPQQEGGAHLLPRPPCFLGDCRREEKSRDEPRQDETRKRESEVKESNRNLR